jgi:hypothetical protein
MSRFPTESKNQFYLALIFSLFLLVAGDGSVEASHAMQREVFIHASSWQRLPAHTHQPAWVTEPSVSNQASPSAVPNHCWPNTNNTLPTRSTNLLVAAELPWAQQVSLYPTMASSPSLPPKKQGFHDSATEELVPPPQNQRQKPTTGATTTA